MHKTVLTPEEHLILLLGRGDVSLRVCADIDILVPRDMVTRAVRLLESREYISEDAPGFFLDLLLRNGNEYGLTREERGFRYVLDLHWGILWGGRSETKVLA